MTNRSTKRALLTSIMAMVLCVAMLAGTTFAWFTDSVTSANNKIMSGSLKVDLEVLGTDGKTWTSVADMNEPIFNYDNWEPGYTEMKFLKVVNEGTLDIQWKAMLVTGGEISKLAEVIDVYVYDFNEGEVVIPADRSLTGWTNVGTLATFIAGIESTTKGEILANDTQDAYQALGIAFKMQETASNDYQNLTLGAFDITIVASQLASESDSFNNQYDSAAKQSIFLNNIEFKNCTLADAVAAAADGDTVYATGEHAPITITKNITLKLTNVKITATETGANAITIAPEVATVSEDDTATGLTANIEIEGVTTLTGATNGDGINVAAGATLNLSGNGTLVAKGNAGVEDKESANGGSGIDVAGTIAINDIKVVAEGYGKHAFGIGGATKSITITDATVLYAKGGFVQPNFVSDLKYGKSELESGAAIGSSTQGAVITLTNTVVTKAEGGSKAAGIGGKFWTGVTINITNCDITAFGGNASAGIGGSRISGDADARGEDITINIVDSTINATGGQYGAGIGSGYDTHCTTPDKNFAICTINIKGDSKITAQGGQYAAGIGTGYHAGGLDGVIEDTVEVTAASGEKFYKAAYFEAMDIGFGVIDPARDGFQNTCSLTYKGEEIVLPVLYDVAAKDVTTLNESLSNGDKVVLSDDIKNVDSEKYYGNASNLVSMTNGGTLDGNGKTIEAKDEYNDTYDTVIYTAGGTIKNVTIDGAMRGIFSWGLKEDLIVDHVIFNDVIYTLNDDASNGYAIKVTNSVLNGWTSYTSGHSEVSFTNCQFGEGMGYAFLNAHNATTFTNCDFAEGYKVNPANTSANLTFVNCTYNGELLTADNIANVLYAASDAKLCTVDGVQGK